MHPASIENAPIGFGAGTSGGGSASAVTVTTLDAFETAVTGSTAKVVRVSGLISLGGQVDVGSNTTVLGVGSSSGFTGGGLRLKKVTNVVVRNLDISKPVAPSGGVTVQASTKVWIDHNSFSADRDHDKDYYDGLLDITKLVRSCGNCSTQYKRTIVVSDVDVTASGKPVVGINQNYGDTATLTKVRIHGDSSKKIKPCVRYQGNSTGAEPTGTGSGADRTYCRYAGSDITYS
ncbi:pectate lyase [Streptomyces sp. NBC_01571]|uniref:pectate lyase n=1 Tax=Streptomyces sp. NBC_01571 TaxID=2975883 RepID=UPI00225BB6FC|nr:pectate lyase [Streptomyces sp. NBC_01571]MCX4579742.1 pectate lyase [Streptomyces sp. NBC_01571]